MLVSHERTHDSVTTHKNIPFLFKKDFTLSCLLKRYPMLIFATVLLAIVTLATPTMRYIGH